MKVISIKKGVEDRNAYCRDCNWNSLGLNSNTKARYHSSKFGHIVDVYTENWSKIKPVNNLKSKDD